MAEPAKAAPGTQGQAQPKSTEVEKSDKGSFVPEASEEALEKGYWGTRDNPIDDEEFSAATGPTSPVTDAHGNELEYEGDYIQKKPPEEWS